MSKGSTDHPVVSVVIVNFNGGPLLNETVRAVLCSSVPVEVFVSDNGSKDGSLTPLSSLRTDPRLRIIENRANLGFSRGNNVALKQAVGDHVLLLNPDCLIQPDTLARMLTAMANYPQTVMAGCLIRNPDGTEQTGCRRSVPSPWRTLVRVLHLYKLFPHHPRFRHIALTQEPLPDKPVFLEAISGAFMLIRRDALEQIGLLDEGYFLHCEDLDLCLQFHRMNRLILFVPDVEVVHYKGTCSADRPIRVLWYKHKGMVRFYLKFFRHQYPSVLMVMVITAVWFRFSILALGAVVRSIGPRRLGPSMQVLPVTASSRKPRRSLGRRVGDFPGFLGRAQRFYKVIVRQKTSVHRASLPVGDRHESKQRTLASAWPPATRGGPATIMPSPRSGVAEENRDIE